MKQRLQTRESRVNTFPEIGPFGSTLPYFILHRRVKHNTVMLVPQLRPLSNIISHNDVCYLSESWFIR